MGNSKSDQKWWEAALGWPDEIKTSSIWRTQAWIRNLRQRQLTLWTRRELGLLARGIKWRP
jgi:hypothetical protein